MTAIAVRCDGNPDDGWACRVTLSDGAREVSAHEVRVGGLDLRRLAPDAPDPTSLVEVSFEFLLERESPQSILRSFDLLDVARYFPEYEAEIRKRHSGPI